MDASALSSSRARGLRYLEGGSRNVARKLRVVEQSSREIASELRSEFPPKPHSVSPLRPTKQWIKPEKHSRENAYKEAEKWLEKAAQSDWNESDREYEEVRRRLIDQFSVFADCKPVLECNYELVSDVEDARNSPISQYFRLNRPPDLQGKQQTEVVIVDTRKLPYRNRCVRCGILALTAYTDSQFECLACKSGKLPVMAQTCGALCVETIVENREKSPVRVRTRKDSELPDEEEKLHPSRQIVRILLCDSLLRREAASERSSLPVFPRKLLQSPNESDSIFPGTPTFALPLTPQERIIRESIALLRKTARTISAELTVKLNEQSQIAAGARQAQRKSADLLCEYGRCMRMVIRGVMQVLPEHAACVEKSLLAACHLCEICYRSGVKEVDDLKEELKVMNAKLEDAVALKVKIKSLERELTLQDVKSKAKLDSLLRMSRKYEEMLRLCPSD